MLAEEREIMSRILSLAKTPLNFLKELLTMTSNTLWIKDLGHLSIALEKSAALMVMSIFGHFTSMADCPRLARADILFNQTMLSNGSILKLTIAIKKL